MATRGRGRVPRQHAVRMAESARNEHVQAVIDENFDELEETAVCSSRTLRNRRAVAASYLEFLKNHVKYDPEEAWHDTDHSPLERKIVAFLSHRAQNSTSRSGNKFMSVKTLMTLRWSILALVFEFAAIPYDRRAYWTDATLRHVRQIQNDNCLESLKMERMLFGVLELRLLIEATQRSVVCWENTIQHICAMLFHFLLGLRPSSIYKTRVNPEFFLQMKNIQLRRTQTPGVFDLEITVTRFKGYEHSRIRLVYSIRAPRLRRNVYMYLAGYLVALQFRRGEIAGCNTIEDVLDVNQAELVQFTHPDRPVFRASSPRGLSVHAENAMRDDGARDYMKRMALAAGITGVGGNTVGASSMAFRHGFATQLSATRDQAEVAKAMAHRAGSHTVADVYDDGNRRLDFFGILTGEVEDRTLQATRGPATYQVKDPIQPITRKELLDRVPMLAILDKQANNLASCIALGGGDEDGDWRSLIYDSISVGENDTPETMLLWTKGRMKKMAELARKAYSLEYRQQQQRDLVAKITPRERQERARQLEKPYDFVQHLKDSRERMLQNDLPDLRDDDGEDVDAGDNDTEAVLHVGEPDLQETLDEKGDIEQGEVPDNKPEAVANEMTVMIVSLATIAEPTHSHGFMCDLCPDDPTIPPEILANDYHFQSRLTKHLHDYHRPWARAKRYLDAFGVQERGGRRLVYRCPWTGATFSSLIKLMASLVKKRPEGLDLDEVRYLAQGAGMAWEEQEEKEEEEEEEAVLEEIDSALRHAFMLGAVEAVTPAGDEGLIVTDEEFEEWAAIHRPTEEDDHAWRESVTGSHT